MPQLSVAVGVNVAVAPAGLVHWSVIGAGHVITGGVLSDTFTLPLQVAVNPAGSATVSVAVVVPRVNVVGT